MRHLLIDTTAITLPCPRRRGLNDDGEELLSVNLLASSVMEITAIPVKVYGLVNKLAFGEPVKATGLVTMPWANNKGAEVSFRPLGSNRPWRPDNARENWMAGHHTAQLWPYCRQPRRPPRTARGKDRAAVAP